MIASLLPYLFLLGQWGMGPGPGISRARVTPLVTTAQTAGSASTSVTTISTTTGIAVTAGDVVVVFCRNGSSATTTWTATSSTSDTFSSLPIVVPGGGSDKAFYTLSAVGGASVTFTCTTSTNSAFTGVIAWAWHPPHAMVLDTSDTKAETPGQNYITNSFTTTAAGVIFVCGDAAFGTTYSIGAIGGATPTLIAQNNAFCEGIITTGAQSSITGQVLSTNTGNWGGFALALK